MNGGELIELVMSQDVILMTIIILFFIGLVSVLVYWIILGKRALERRRARVESVGSAESCKQNEDII